MVLFLVFLSVVVVIFFFHRKSKARKKIESETNCHCFIGKIEHNLWCVMRFIEMFFKCFFLLLTNTEKEISYTYLPTSKAEIDICLYLSPFYAVRAFDSPLEWKSTTIIRETIRNDSFSSFDNFAALTKKATTKKQINPHRHNCFTMSKIKKLMFRKIDSFLPTF